MGELNVCGNQTNVLNALLAVEHVFTLAIPVNTLEKLALLKEHLQHSSFISSN